MVLPSCLEEKVKELPVYILMNISTSLSAWKRVENYLGKNCLHNILACLNQHRIHFSKVLLLNTFPPPLLVRLGDCEKEG